MGDDDNETTHNPLADQLADLDLDVSEGDGEVNDAAHHETSSPSTADDGGPASSGPGDQGPSEEELFRRAVDNLDPDDIPPDGDPGPPPSSSSPSRSRSAGAEDDDGSDAPAVRSDEELFREAVDSLEPGEMYKGKFRGSSGTGDDLPEQAGDTGEAVDSHGVSDRETDRETTSEKADEETLRRRAGEFRDESLFRKMVGDVEPLEGRDKYRQPRRRSADHGIDDGDDDELVTPSLPRSGEGLHYVPPFVRSQRELLARHDDYEERHEVPVLNIRGQHRDQALDDLRDFVGRHVADGVRFVRIIPGRGLRSEVEPVLKPAVLAWLEGPGIDDVVGYVPERLQGGDYGSLIVELAS